MISQARTAYTRHPTVHGVQGIAVSHAHKELYVQVVNVHGHYLAGGYHMKVLL